MIAKALIGYRWGLVQFKPCVSSLYSFVNLQGGGLNLWIRLEDWELIKPILFHQTWQDAAPLSKGMTRSLNFDLLTSDLTREPVYTFLLAELKQVFSFPVSRR